MVRLTVKVAVPPALIVLVALVLAMIDTPGSGDDTAMV
jgi:hypothetical protein